MAKNVFGEELIPCCVSPITGFYRDGFCRTGNDDVGTHTVCAIMTKEFLDFSKSVGNDLSAALPAYGFAGLKPGDRWCLCLSRWMQAYNSNVAPNVILEATHEKTLTSINLEALVKFAVKIEK